MTLRVGSLFSGVGGLELGFDQAGGYETVWQVEKDAACQRVLARRFPGVPRYFDVKEIDGGELVRRHGPIDVLIGGFPCQDLSLAGRRAGLAGQRSSLFYEFARLAREVAARWVVIENVPGLLSSGCKPPCPGGCVAAHGGDMGAVVWALGQLGYGYAWRVLDAQHFGVPQRRRRVIVVGHLGTPWSAPAEVLFEPDCGPRDPAQSGEAEEIDADGVEGGAREPRRPGRPKADVERTVNSLTARSFTDAGPDLKHAEAGHLVPIGVPDVADTLGSAGNGRGWNNDLDRAGAFIPVADEIDGQERLFVGSEWDDQLARPLTAVEHGPRYDFDTENWIVEGEPVAFTCKDSGQDAGPVAPTLRAMPHDESHANGGGQVAVALSLRGRAEGNVPELEPGDVCPALRQGAGGSGNPMVLTNDTPDCELCGDGPCLYDCGTGEPFTVHNGDDVLWQQGRTAALTDSRGQTQAVCIHRDALSRDGVSLTESHNYPGDIPRKRDAGIGIRYDDKAYTLDATGAHAVAAPDVPRPACPDDEEACPDCRHEWDVHGGGRCDCASVPFRKVHRATSPDDYESWEEAAVANTLNGHDYSNVRTTQAIVHPDAGLTVRRLTPLECERLQGFPDGWTDGESDSARYRMLGNAVAVNVARWLASRLRPVAERLKEAA